MLKSLTDRMWDAGDVAPAALSLRILWDADDIAKFNPNHDERGRFSASDRPLAGDAEHLSDERLRVARERETKYIQDLAEKYGYPADLVDVSYEPKAFQLNGKEYFYGGGADPETGVITIWPDQFGSYTPMEGTMVHEIMHQRYQTFKEVLGAERNELVNLSRTSEWSDKSPLSPSGALRPELADKYPVFAAVNGVVGQPLGAPGWGLTDTRGLAETDGVTDYSRQWWKSGKTESAVNETLAEIAATELRQTGKNPFKYDQVASGSPMPVYAPSNQWGKLYNAVNMAWNQSHGDAPVK